jgi:hypothetical protein
MGKCLQVTHALKQNITGGGSFEALSAGTGDSFSVPNFAQGSRASLLEVWGGISAHAGEFDIRSPDFHDNTRGLRMAYTFNPTLSGADGDPQLLLPPRVVQPLYASDVLTVEVNGTNTDNVALDYLAYYENLPGADQRLMNWTEVQARTIDNLGIRVSVTAGATGDYGSNRTLNQDEHRLRDPRHYLAAPVWADRLHCSRDFGAADRAAAPLERADLGGLVRVAEPEVRARLHPGHQLEQQGKRDLPGCRRRSGRCHGGDRHHGRASLALGSCTTAEVRPPAAGSCPRGQTSGWG